ncbi:NAD-dependent epimerase/dehydratase family protein [Candidatus Uhrbacteria bacterium]|nr:MAG: NAD-dependent epimerase/dehydratase family protein [Candidatus Uhrbacteria bacterium]
MKILVFGSRGFIGGKMLRAWPDAVGTDARIDDKASVLKALDEHRPDAVVNAAGRTGRPNVDWCESHQAETHRDNVIGALTLGEACHERGVYLLHLSSGCVFYGHSPDPRGWREEDFANPSATYSRSKYAAELALMTYPNVAIVRLRMPIDDAPSERNLIDKLANYKQVVDVANSVTVVPDLIDACRRIIEKRGTGVFHTVNPGVMRHRDLLDLYREYVDPNHRVEWIREEELVSKGLATKKRSNNVMQSKRLQELGIEMRPIDVALRDTMIKYAENNKRATSNEYRRMESGATLLATRYSNPRMKGLILAGGKGTRLAPLTNTTNKHLLPVGKKQMILYPLQTLLDAGIRDIMIVTGPDHAGHFMNLLGSGAALSCRLTYRIQDEAGGIAHAVALAEDFVGQDHVTVILGDNIFEDNFLAPISSFQGGALTFYKAVHDPHRFGVVEVDPSGRVLSIEEKPAQPKSSFAQVGLYVYDATVFDVIRALKPSTRGELEIAHTNSAFLAQGRLVARPVRGFWSDAGTFESLRRASEFMESRNP